MVLIFESNSNLSVLYFFDNGKRLDSYKGKKGDLNFQYFSHMYIARCNYTKDLFSVVDLSKRSIAV